MEKTASHKLSKLLIAFLLVVNSLGASAQRFADTTGVHKLATRDRIHLHTNYLDWALAIPNIGVEYELGSYNYSRWTVGLNLRSRWTESHTFLPGTVYSLTEVRVEARNYWRAKQIDGDNGDYPAHKKIWDKALSLRRTRVKHPTWTWYRGLYLSYGDFSLAFGGKGRQGTAITGGVTYGFVRPLLTFRHGTTLDLDFGISAGVAMANVEKYELYDDDNCYVRTQAKQTKIMPTITEVRLGFIYRLGKHAITDRYRYRFDVDALYKDSIINARQAAETARLEQERRDASYKDVYDAYIHVYDSVAAINAKQNAATAAAQAEAAKKAAALQKAAARAAKDSTSAAEKAAKEEAKKAKKAAKDEPKPTEEAAATPSAEGITPSAEPTAPATEPTAPAAEQETPAAEGEEPKTESEAPAESTEQGETTAPQEEQGTPHDEGNAAPQEEEKGGEQ